MLERLLVLVGMVTVFLMIVGVIADDKTRGKRAARRRAMDRMRERTRADNRRG